MSRRTRANRDHTPGAGQHSRPSVTRRRHANQATRRAEHQALHEALHQDPEAVLIPAGRRDTVDLEPGGVDGGGTAPRRFKVWKTKMWKRRSTMRRQRAQAEAALRRQL